MRVYDTSFFKSQVGVRSRTKFSKMSKKGDLKYISSISKHIEQAISALLNLICILQEFSFYTVVPFFLLTSIDE